MLCFSVISRAPGLKLVVETLMSSLKPIGNIVVICCAFFIIFGILGVQVRGEGDDREATDRHNEKGRGQYTAAVQTAMTQRHYPSHTTLF